MSYLDATVLNASSVDFGAPNKLGSTQQMVIPLSTIAGRFDWGSQVRLQFGKDQNHMLHTQYGCGPAPQSDSNRYNLDIVPDSDLALAMRTLDATVVDYCEKNCEELFRTKLLTKQYTPVLKDKTEDGGGLSIRIKVVVEEEEEEKAKKRKLGTPMSKPTTIQRFLDETKTEVTDCDYTSIPRDSQVIVLADTPGVWYNSTAYGVSFTARKILTLPPPSKHGLQDFSLLPGVVEVASRAVDDDGAA